MTTLSDDLKEDIICPECGKKCLQWIEDIETESGEEIKEARTCHKCNIIVYIVKEIT